ncbi:MAG: hypothetical protein QM692_21000 [Thermomicrobiales bacterium]
MQHSAVDLENYARIYHAERMREAQARRQVNEVPERTSWLAETVRVVREMFSVRMVVEPVAPAAPAVPVVDVPAAPLVSLRTTRRAATAEPYAGMIVLVRGPRQDAA